MTPQTPAKPGPLTRRIQQAQAPKPEPKWQPAWLRNLTARDETGRLS